MTTQRKKREARTSTQSPSSSVSYLVKRAFFRAKGFEGPLDVRGLLTGGDAVRSGKAGVLERERDTEPERDKAAVAARDPVWLVS